MLISTLDDSSGVRFAVDELGDFDLHQRHSTFGIRDTHAIDTQLYPEVSFAATHNSYAGGISLRRVSISRQLDGGVRALELDVHDDDYAEHGFRIGHLSAEEGVYWGDGNPQAPELQAWLGLITTWSNGHPDHAPITLLIDLKDSLSDNENFDEGDLFALNEALRTTFGERLLRAEEIEGKGWPAIGAMRGRILTVLSGDEGARLSYRGSSGAHPAVAMNARGDVVLVHDDQNGDLWSWTGTYAGDQGVRWHRRTRYDTGENPAVALRHDGVIVEVHEDPDLHDDQVWYRVGRLGENFEIEWSQASGIAMPDGDGLDPIVRFTENGRVLEMHDRPGEDSFEVWAGRIDETSGEIRWLPAPNTVERGDERLAVSGGRRVQVYCGADGGLGRDTLLYSTDRSDAKRVRPEQLAFVEVQHGNESELEADNLMFYSASAAEMPARLWAAGKRAAGKVARLWCFNDADLTHEASVNFPATDLPFARWYRGYGSTLGCAQ